MPSSKAKTRPESKKGSSQHEAKARRDAFVEAYLLNDGNITKAALAVGFSPKTAAQQGSRLFKHVEVQQAIEQRRAQVLAAAQEKTGITAERVLREAWSIATADPRELVEYHIGCCRHCWGQGYRYQRTAQEMERDEAAHAKLNEELIEADKPSLGEFDRKGGIGFHALREPNAGCPECFGQGVGRTVLKDTRNISPAAASLFAGIKETRDGFEVKFHSKADGLEKLFKHLGLYEKDNRQGGEPLAEAMLELAAMDPLKGLFAKRMGKATA